MWIVIFCALSAIAAPVLSFLVARRVVADAASSARSARSVVSRVELLEASVSETQDLVKDLANSLKMARVRRAGLTHAAGNEPPNPYTHPDEWRKFMNKQRGANGRAMLGGD